MVQKTDNFYLSFPYGCFGYANTSFYTGSIPTYTRSRTWTRTPNFRKRNMWKGELPMQPYDDERLERKLNTSSVTLRRLDSLPPLQVTYYGNFGYEDPPQVTLPHPDHAELAQKALGKIPARINGTQFNLPLFMFEWHKTVDMVEALAKDIANKMKRAGSRRQVHNMWLEYRYGWRLLVMDIYDGLCAVHDRRLNHSVMSVQAGATKTYDFPPIIRNENMGTRYINNGMKTQFSLKRDYVIGLDYTIRFRESSAQLGGLQQFGITNPLGLAWELIPYSFVIDWLIPVSDYLSKLDTWVGKDFVSGTVSYWVDIHHTCKPFGLRDPLNPAWVEKPGGIYAASEIHRRFYKRAVLSKFPMVSPPAVQLSLNCSRMLDAVSLMLQRRR